MGRGASGSSIAGVPGGMSVKHHVFKRPSSCGTKKAQTSDPMQRRINKAGEVRQYVRQVGTFLVQKGLLKGFAHSRASHTLLLLLMLTGSSDLNHVTGHACDTPPPSSSLVMYRKVPPTSARCLMSSGSSGTLLQSRVRTIVCRHVYLHVCRN